MASRYSLVRASDWDDIGETIDAVVQDTNGIMHHSLEAEVISFGDGVVCVFVVVEDRVRCAWPIHDKTRAKVSRK